MQARMSWGTSPATHTFQSTPFLSSLPGLCLGFKCLGFGQTQGLPCFGSATGHLMWGWKKFSLDSQAQGIQVGTAKFCRGEGSLHREPCLPLAGLFHCSLWGIYHRTPCMQRLAGRMVCPYYFRRQKPLLLVVSFLLHVGR